MSLRWWTTIETTAAATLGDEVASGSQQRAAAVIPPAVRWQSRLSRAMDDCDTTEDDGGRGERG